MDYKTFISKYQKDIAYCMYSDPVRLKCENCKTEYEVRPRCNNRYMCPRCAKAYEREESRRIMDRYNDFLEALQGAEIINGQGTVSLCHLVLTFPEEIREDISLDNFGSWPLRDIVKKVVYPFMRANFGKVGGVMSVHLNGDKDPLKYKPHLDITFLNVRYWGNQKYEITDRMIDLERLRGDWTRRINEYFLLDRDRCVLWYNFTDIMKDKKMIHKVKYQAHGLVDGFNNKGDWHYSDMYKINQLIGKIPLYFHRYRWFSILSNRSAKNHMYRDREIIDIKKRLNNVCCPNCQSNMYTVILETGEDITITQLDYLLDNEAVT